MAHRKDEENIKSRNWSFRLTPADDDKLKEIINDAGYSTIGQYVRGKLLGQNHRKVVARVSQVPVSHELIKQIKGIGANLNQSQMTMNSILKAGYLSEQTAERYIKDLRDLIYKLNQITSKLYP